MHGHATHDHIIRSTNRPITESLHPYVYAATLALALLLVISAWGFAGDHAGLTLAVVSVFVFIAAALPVILWRIGHNHHARNGARFEPFADWAESEFVVWQGHLKGRDAAVLVLLPIAAVACGMTLFAALAHFFAVATG